MLQLFSSSIFAHIVSFSFSFLLARIYSPTYWADFTLFNVIAHVFGIIANGKFEFALFLPRDTQKQDLLFLLSILVSLGSFIVMMLFVFLLYIWDISPFENYSIRVWFVFPALASLVGVQNSFFAWYNSKREYARMFLPRLFRSSFVNSSQSLMGFVGYKLNGLWVGFVVGHFLNTAFFVVTNLRQLVHICHYKRKKLYLFALLRFYRNYPKYFMLSEILDFLSSQLPIVFFAYFFDSTVLGQYGFAFRFVVLPLVLVAASVNKVFLERSAKQSMVSAGELAFEILKKTSLLIVVPFFCLLFGADYIFVSFFGDKWQQAGEFVQLLSPWLAMMFISVPISSFFAAKEKQKQGLLANIILLSARGIALFVGAVYYESPYYSLMLYSLVGFTYWTLICAYIFTKTGVPLLQVFWYFVKVFGPVYLFFQSLYFLFA